MHSKNINLPHTDNLEASSQTIVSYSTYLIFNANCKTFCTIIRRSELKLLNLDLVRISKMFNNRNVRELFFFFEYYRFCLNLLRIFPRFIEILETQNLLGVFHVGIFLHENQKWLDFSIFQCHHLKSRKFQIFCVI